MSEQDHQAGPLDAASRNAQKLISELESRRDLEAASLPVGRDLLERALAAAENARAAIDESRLSSDSGRP